MKGCELCHRDGALSELYCRDCCKWICSVCGTVHLAIKGAGDHDIITAAEQRRRQTLKQQLTHIHAKIESCTRQIRKCDEETTVLNQNKVTSLKSSSNARQSCHKQIDQLFDNINERLQSFAVRNTATYMLARERLTDSMTQLRQLQCSVEEALYMMSSGATSVDVSMTQRIQASLDDIASDADKCVAAGATAPKLYLSLNDKLSLDGVASFDEVCGNICDDVQQPDAEFFEFDWSLLADYITSSEYDLTKSHSDQSATQFDELNFTTSSRSSGPPADDAEDMTVPAAAVSKPPTPCCAMFDECLDGLPATPPQLDEYPCSVSFCSDVGKTVRVVHVKDVAFSAFVTEEYDSSAPISRHGRQLKQPDRY